MPLRAPPAVSAANKETLLPLFSRALNGGFGPCPSPGSGDTGPRSRAGGSPCVLFPSSSFLLRPPAKNPEESQFKAVGAVFLGKNPCRGSGRGDGVSRFVRMQTPEDVVLNLYAFHAAKEYRCVKVVSADHGPAHFGQTRVKITIHGINETNFLEFGHFGGNRVLKKRL